ncbi:MAG TPA: hypothetical protein VHU83_05915 [Bryobacteraceae bacterium]|jgi:hypothetical protein|nr:hypothetical protein [Bryobacteraceae bacterium]
MSTEAQIRANQQNAQHSTGPITGEGKAASCQNNFKYGLTGASFTVLDFEDQDEYDHVLCGLRFEHQPSTMTESILVEKMAQSYWLSKRALYLQDQCATDEELTLEQQQMDEPAVLSEVKTQKRFALFLRYQTTNDRAFHRCLADLLKLRAEKRRSRLDEAALSQRAEDAKKIGFESQQRHEAEQSRKAAAEKRKHELHEFAVLLAEAKLDHQFILNSNAKLASHAAAAGENCSLEAPKAA